eukprot:1620732-Ditylum_brightwellii.AAC.1
MKIDLEHHLSTAVISLIESNIIKFTQIMEDNGNQMMHAISITICGGNSQGESNPTQMALDLGCIEQSSASNAIVK